ncbi:MAG: restriction endonuclease subunit S [Candidatus Methanoperedens sp.]|nr:restriction endonuclease subunit S [Candidatus Methanoperedens sp.]
MSSKGWKKGKLDDIADITMGQSPAGETCNEKGDGIPLLNGPTEFGNSHPVPVQFTTDPKKFADLGDLLFCVRGSTTGRMNWANQRFAIGRGISALRHKDGNQLQPFLKAVLDFNLPTLLTEATGSTFPNVSSQQLKSLEISIPPLQTQKRIASILAALDDKIEFNHQTNQTLEAIAQTLFKEWFENFNFPGATGEMQDSELGPIPKRWRVYRLGELIDSVSITHKFNCDKVIFLNTSDIEDGKILNHNYSSIEGLPGQAKKSIKKLDILFTEIRPANKRYALINFDAEDYVVSTKLMVLRTISHIHPIIIYNFITSNDVLTGLQHLAESRSGTFPQITFNQVKELKIALPKDALAEQYTKLAWSIFENKSLNEQQTQTLAQIRDNLLPKLLSGEIEV